MGSGQASRAWLKDLADFIRAAERELGSLEAVIIYGSAAKDLQVAWSDIDVMLVSEAFKDQPIPDRIGRLLKLAKPRIEPVGYTFKELENMVEKANPLALNALIEGRPLKESPRIHKLRLKASATYVRKGRTWLPKQGQPPKPR